MAVRNAQQTWVEKTVSRTVWSGLLSGDTGSPESGARLSDKCVHINGTPGVGGALDIEGSNDGVNWKLLTDPQGNTLHFTAANQIEQIEENPLLVRPNAIGGDGTTSWIVTMVGKGVK